MNLRVNAKNATNLQNTENSVLDADNFETIGNAQNAKSKLKHTAHKNSI